MKNYILGILILFLTMACKTEEKKALLAENKEEIKVYNFDDFEKFINKENDKMLVVNFWATWCKPCIKELPYFEALNSKSEALNVEVLLVSLDFPDKIENQLKPFLKKNNLQSEVVLLDAPNENEWIPKIDSTWSGAIPATLIINDGEQYFYEQSFTQKELFDVISKHTTP